MSDSVDWAGDRYDVIKGQELRSPVDIVCLDPKSDTDIHQLDDFGKGCKP